MWNKIAAFMVVATGMCLILAPIDTEARGGGGGRGGGGRAGGGSRGGSYKGGHTMNRTPTMSRAARTPSDSRGRQQAARQTPARTTPARPATRPAMAQNRGTVSRPGSPSMQRTSAANRAELRNQVNRYEANRPRDIANRPDFKQKAQNFSNNRPQQLAQNRQLSDRASQRLKQVQPNSKDWFNRNFFDRHNLDNDYGRLGNNWWRPVGWAALADWGGWGWGTPYYYDDGGYAYPVSSSDYSYDNYPSSSSTNTTPAAPAPTDTVVQQPPTTAPSLNPLQSSEIAANEEEGDWMPLGVFAVSNNANTAAQSNRFIQLAISRSGEIAGVLYNSATDSAQDLAGILNKETQMAYWSFDNKPGAPVASTGIYNLTQDQTPITVRFSDGAEQTWTLVRLKQ